MSTIVNTVKISSTNAPNVTATSDVEFDPNDIILIVNETANVGTNIVYVGDTFTYTVEITNTSTIIDATGVVIIDDAPPHILFNGATISIGSLTTNIPSNIVWNVGTIPANTSAIIVINVMVI